MPKKRNRSLREHTIQIFLLIYGFIIIIIIIWYYKIVLYFNSFYLKRAYNLHALLCHGKKKKRIFKSSIEKVEIFELNNVKKTLSILG